MAKGEGADQYSNNSLLTNKPVNPDVVKLAGKVSWLMYSFMNNNISSKCVCMNVQPELNWRGRRLWLNSDSKEVERFDNILMSNFLYVQPNQLV